jgi:hypothetical protein
VGKGIVYLAFDQDEYSGYWGCPGGDHHHGVDGPGTYAAPEPLLQYRSTPVQVVTAFNAATGLKRGVLHRYARSPKSSDGFPGPWG